MLTLLLANNVTVTFLLHSTFKLSEMKVCEVDLYLCHLFTKHGIILLC